MNFDLIHWIVNSRLYKNRITILLTFTTLISYKMTDRSKNYKTFYIEQKKGKEKRIMDPLTKFPTIRNKNKNKIHIKHCA